MTWRPMVRGSSQRYQSGELEVCDRRLTVWELHSHLSWPQSSVHHHPVYHTQEGSGGRGKTGQSFPLEDEGSTAGAVSRGPKEVPEVEVAGQPKDSDGHDTAGCPQS